MATVFLQIIEKPGMDLLGTLQAAMRDGTLHTFLLEKRGKKVVHKNAAYPGWMNWSRQHGVITATILSPNKPGAEWKLLSAFVGRLADRYADRIASLSIQFAALPETRTSRRRRKR
jgi:hypothetical protein